MNKNEWQRLKRIEEMITIEFDRVGVGYDSVGPMYSIECYTLQSGYMKIFDNRSVSTVNGWKFLYGLLGLPDNAGCDAVWELLLTLPSCG